MNPVEMTIAICGHVKHGKSTLAGRLLYDLGGITKDRLEKKWRMAPQLIPEFEKNRKDFNKFNYIFLENRSSTFSPTGSFDDQSRTAFPSRGSVSIGGQRITIVDEPGHLKFIDNIVYGIYLSSFGVIVVDALDGVTDSTVQMTQLLAFFEIPVIAICVTKMDRVGYSSSAFNDVSDSIDKKLINPYLHNTPPIIPVCALLETQEEINSNLAWYEGKSLADIVIDPNMRNKAQAIKTRCSVKEVFNPPGVSTVLVGMLETGEMSVHDELLLEPASHIYNRDIVLKPRSLQQARGVNEPKPTSHETLHARTIAAIAVPNLSVKDAKLFLKHGGMLGKRDDRPSVASRIQAEIIFFRSHKVYSGKKYIFLTNTSDTPARISEISEKRELVSTASDVIQGEIVRAKLDLEFPTCIESDKELGRLTRFALREENEVIGCGRCTLIVA